MRFGFDPLPEGNQGHGLPHSLQIVYDEGGKPVPLLGMFPTWFIFDPVNASDDGGPEQPQAARIDKNVNADPAN